MDTDTLSAIKARVHSTELTDNPDFAAAIAVAGLAALARRSAERAHASNRETVRNGTNGPGVLEVTERDVLITENDLNIALDDIADQLVRQRAAEDEALKQAGLDALHDQAAGTMVDARGTVLTDTNAGADRVPHLEGE
jgi:hypothetical protein